ncbi:hypothetical protein UQW22_03275 [Isoptericola halotolerans]|uniref:hypothetical protein n=1 Tax=Isoptericola halotolerans TaxID=300560 RepID=UPI003890951A
MIYAELSSKPSARACRGSGWARSSASRAKRYSKAVVEEQATPPVLNVNFVPSPKAASRPHADGPSEALSALFPRLDADNLGRVREVLLSLHHEAQGAEAERFEESLNRLLEDA